MHGELTLAKKSERKRKRRVRSDIVVHDRRALEVGRNAVVGTISVDDPYGQPGDKILVFRSLRTDPLAAMHDAGHVDEAQLHAGRRWQRAYELAEVGGATAIDPTREAVDGGRIPEPFTDEQREAVGELAKASRALGLEGESIVRDILGRRYTVSVAAAARGLISEPEKKYIGRRFRECLETLAVLYGYAMKRAV